MRELKLLSTESRDEAYTYRQFEPTFEEICNFGNSSKIMLSLLVFPEHLRALIRRVRSVSRFLGPTKSRKVFTGLIEETMVFAEYSTPFSSFTPVATESDILSELTLLLKRKSKKI